MKHRSGVLSAVAACRGAGWIASYFPMHKSPPVVRGDEETMQHAELR